jgi:MFS family permease
MHKPFYGWIIVGVTFLIGATEAGAFQNILSVFLKPMAGEFGWSRAAVTGAMAFGSICAGILSPFIGPVLDRHGPRIIAFGSVLVLSTGLVLMAFANRIWQLYLFFGMGRMVAVGALSLVISVSVANWFIRRRGRAMGIAWLGPRFGSAALPAIVQFSILTFGWRAAWAILGCIVFVMSGIPALIFLRRKPEDIGLLPDGDQTKSSHTNMENEDVQSGPEVFSETSEPVWTRYQATHNMVFWALTFLSGLMTFTQAGINFHLYPFMTDHGVNEISAVLVLSTIAAFGALGAVLWGFFAERIRIQSLLGINSFCSCLIFLILFLTVKSELFVTVGVGVLFLLAASYGILHGGRMPIMAMVWPEFYGRTSMGSIYGFSSPFRFTANAIGPIFAAICFDLFGGYGIPFSVYTISFFMTGICWLFLKPPRHPKSFVS